MSPAVPAKYDWYLKADDDTYFVWPNLVRLLRLYGSVRRPVYLGATLRRNIVGLPRGFNSGGAGYVLNRDAVLLLASERTSLRRSYNVTAEEMTSHRDVSAKGTASRLDESEGMTSRNDDVSVKVLTSHHDDISKEGVTSGRDACKSDGVWEDVDVALCLQTFDVLPEVLPVDPDGSTPVFDIGNTLKRLQQMPEVSCPTSRIILLCSHNMVELNHSVNFVS